MSDAGERQARNIAWQFEQVREAISRTFPWIRVDTALPLVVLAARGEASMRALAPQFWEGRDGSSLASVSQPGRDRNYILLRADVRAEDREGINPYQNAYWAYVATALNDTSDGIPLWLRRGLASMLSNTLVRENEVQVGRVLPQHLQRLRERARMPLQEVVGFEHTSETSLDALTALDAHAWAFVHFLAFAEERRYAPLLDAYVRAVLSGEDPAASLASTIGDVARFDTPFAVYVERALFGYLRFGIEARISREALKVREMPPGESAAIRASFHVAMDRPAEASALIAEAEKAGPGGVADEVRALAAEADGRDADLAALLERAAPRLTASWYVPYRLAARLPTPDRTSLERIEALLLQATDRNPYADSAWALLGETQAALGRGEAATASVQRAIRLRPASSGHRVSLARVLHRLGRLPDALGAAGTARSMARTAAERDAAQQVLGELARAAGAETDKPPAATSGADAPAAPLPSKGPLTTATDAPPAEPPATRPSSAAAAPAPNVDVSTLMNRCLTSRRTCEAALPVIVADCEAKRSMSRFAWQGT